MSDAQEPLSLIAATLTPCKADGSLALERIPAYAQQLIADGLYSIFVNGTTGEGLALRDDERTALAEAWREAWPQDRRMLVHVGHESAQAGRNLAAHARALGVDGIAVCAPSYYTPKDAAGCARHLAAIAAGASDLPCYYYHIPAKTGIAVPASAILTEAGRIIGRLAGCKFSHNDFVDFATCRDLADGRYEMLFGGDQILGAALVHGCRGAVGGTFNFAAPLYRVLDQAWRNGDPDRVCRYQDAARAMVAGILRHGGVAAIKAAMGRCEIDCGPPRTALPAVDEAALDAELEAMHFHDLRRGILPDD